MRDNMWCCASRGKSPHVSSEFRGKHHHHHLLRVSNLFPRTNIPVATTKCISLD